MIVWTGCVVSACIDECESSDCSASERSDDGGQKYRYWDDVKIPMTLYHRSMHILPMRVSRIVILLDNMEDIGMGPMCYVRLAGLCD